MMPIWLCVWGGVAGNNNREIAELEAESTKTEKLLTTTATHKEELVIGTNRSG